MHVITRPDAGHRPYFPGEEPHAASPTFDHGGTDATDALLGAEAWPTILRVLRGSGAESHAA